MRQFAVVNAGDAEHEADQRFIGVEGPRDDSTDVVDHVQERSGHDIRLLESPNLALQRDTVVEILLRRQRANAHTHLVPPVAALLFQRKRFRNSSIRPNV